MTEPAVCSHNEWDSLEEAIVGVIEGAAVPPWHVALRATMPPEQWSLFRERGGQPFPPEQVRAASRELDGFARILEAEGVTVRRPDVTDLTRSFGTPEWSSTGGVSSAFPRDVMLVVGDHMIEAPMGWRSYYFAIHPFRSLIKDYFRRGARWTAAPKPQMSDELYVEDFDVQEAAPPDGFASVITEFEPIFDAGDFVRCGRDVFVQRSHVTNRLGIEWVRRQLGEGYRLHELQFEDDHPMHVNATFVPLAPGRVLVNPERVTRVPAMFAGWELLRAPAPFLPGEHPMYMSSRWISMNVLMLDERRVMVEKDEEALIGCLRSWGFEPVTCPFRAVNTFGGGFHCATLDVRRRGALQEYF